MKAHTLRADQFAVLIQKRERNETWRWCDLRKYKYKWRYDRRSGNCSHNKSSSHGVPNVNLFELCFSWSIMVMSWVLPRTSSSKIQILFLKKNIFQEYWLFCSRFITFHRLHLAFGAFFFFFFHLSVICKQDYSEPPYVLYPWVNPFP